MGRKKTVKGGKLCRFVNTPEAIAVFRHVYEIPNDVGLKYVHWSDALVPAAGNLLLPVVAIVEGGVNPNVFRIVMGTVELNRRLGLELDIDFTLVNGLPDTNRGFDEDYLIVSGEWFLLGHKCPTKDGVPDPRRRNPIKSLININSLRELTRTNLALPPIDIRELLDVDAPDMSGINLRNLLPRSREGTSESVPAQSTPARSKRARVESSAGPSRPATSAQPGPSASAAQGTVHVTQLGNVVRSGTPLRSGIRSAGEGSTRLWAPRMEYRGADPVTETDCILPVSDTRNATVASALSQAVRLPLDMEEWRKAADDELINNLRRGLLIGVQASLELEDRFRTNKDHLAHANVLATKYHDAKKMATEGQNLSEPRKKAYESGSKDAQDEMGHQLPGLCNLYYTDAWDDAIAVLNYGQTMLPPKPIKLPFPGAIPPPPPETVLNSPLPQLGTVMVDLEEVESAEAVGPVDADPQDAPDVGSASPEDAGPGNL
uniref:Uncharacterized protein n=1 Tax=Fagus sylvatica TaxID=28930 RepID=A0A2N9IQQ1_FAGSY